MWVIHHGCAPALTLECNLSSLALVRLGHFVKNAAPLRALNGVLLLIAQSTFVVSSRHLFYYVCIYIIYDILNIYTVGEILTVHESPTLEVRIVWVDSSHGVWMCCDK